MYKIRLQGKTGFTEIHPATKSPAWSKSIGNNVPNTSNQAELVPNKETAHISLPYTLNAHISISFHQFR